jgi:hypothetical protein
MNPNEGARPAPAVLGYEPPRIEARWSGIELEREILYAGAPGGSPSPG